MPSNAMSGASPMGAVTLASAAPEGETSRAPVVCVPAGSAELSWTLTRKLVPSKAASAEYSGFALFAIGKPVAKAVTGRTKASTARQYGQA